MKSSKKFGIAVLAVTSAIAILVISAFALFSDNEEKGTSGTIGTVGISLSDPTLSNDDNINPGDYDPNNPDDANPGTDHDLAFTISNTGNKSVDVRNMIVISVADEAGHIYDPTVFSLYTEKDGEYAKAGTELAPKFFMVYGDDTLYTAAQIPAGSEIVAVVYYTDPDDAVCLNGVGEAAEEEDGITETSHDYLYYLVMDRDADNNYQGLTCKIDVIAEAKQHRNTDNDDWEKIATKSITFNGKNYVVVPDKTEDASGVATTIPTITEAP